MEPTSHWRFLEEVAGLNVQEVQETEQINENLELITKIVLDDRIKWAINSFKPYKSPGPDKILPVMLQKSENSIINLPITLFRASLRLKYIPKSWRKVKVIFIPKPGKLDYSLAGSFRPIILTSFMLKALEKLIDTLGANH